MQKKKGNVISANEDREKEREWEKAGIITYSGKIVFLTIHCNPSLAYSPTYVVASEFAMFSTQVYSHSYWMANSRGRGGKILEILG